MVITPKNKDVDKVLDLCPDIINDAKSRIKANENDLNKLVVEKKDYEIQLDLEQKKEERSRLQKNIETCEEQEHHKHNTITSAKLLIKNCSKVLASRQNKIIK